MMPDMDEVFKALSDPTRRSMLDALFVRDGQTLGALAERESSMTRFGVMKHLRVLEDAGLVATRKRGREKLHFLNPVPIQRIHERWVQKYAKPWAASLTALKTRLEAETMDAPRVSFADGTAPIAGDTAVFEIFIKTTPERLWLAITDPEQRRQYSFGAETHSDWTPGSQYRSVVGGGFELATGENVDVDPPRLLVQTFQALWSDDVQAQGATRVTWEIEPVGTSCRLTVTHDLLPAGANAELYGGWPMILSGLKTFLETGELLDTPGSLRYAQVG